MTVIISVTGVSPGHQISDRRDETDCAHDHYHATDHTVDQPQGADIEMRSHFVDKPCDPKPPEHRPDKNGYISSHIMIGHKFGRKETEAGKKTYDKE